MPYDFFGHVADEKPFDSRPTMRGEYDQIDSLILCGIEDLFKRIAASSNTIPSFRGDSVPNFRPRCRP